MAATSRGPAMSCLRLASPELEANPVDGFDDIVAVHRGELGADIANVAVNGAVGHLDIELVGGAHDLLAAENHRRPGQKRPEDSELDGRETKRYAGECRDML